MSKLLSDNPDERPHAEEILNHPLFAQFELEEPTSDRMRQRQRTVSASKG